MKVKDILLLTVALIALASGTASAQVTGDYQTRASGAWNATGTWQRYAGGVWNNNPAIPSSTDLTITILNGHTVTVTADVTIDQTVVAAGGILDVNTDLADLTVANAAGTGADLSITGILRLTHNGATIVPNVGALIRVNNGGVYRHTQNAGTIPTATWSDGSTCELNGVSTNATDPAGLGQSFYNLIWNMSGSGAGLQKEVPNLTTVRNDFTINQISGSTLEFTQGSNRTITVGRDLTLSHASGTVTLNLGSNTVTMNVDRDYIQNDLGAFELSGGSGAGTINVKRDFTASNGSISENSSAACWIRLIGIGDQTLYAFDQDNITNDVNLEINKSSGDVVLAADYRVNGGATLKMVQGDVQTYFYTLTLGSSTSALGTLSWTTGTVIGSFCRWFSASTVSSVSFPIGIDGYHRPILFDFTTAPSSGGTLTGLFLPYDPGIYGLSLTEGSDTYSSTCSDGYWRLTPGDGITGGTYDLHLYATNFACVTDPALLAILKRADDVSVWTLDGSDADGTGTISNPVAHRTGMQGYGEYACNAGGDAPLPIELVDFSVTSTKGKANLIWRTGAEINNDGFEVQRTTEKGTDFSTIASYRTHAELVGLGNSNIGRDYGYVDDGTDGSLIAGEIYRYRLVDVAHDGSRKVHPERAVRIEGGVPAAQLSSFVVGIPKPNPATDVLNLTMTLTEEMPITVSIYTLDGRMISTAIESGSRDAGTYPVAIDTHELRPGAYTVVLVTPQGVRARPFLIVR
ncbi:MAG: T9SS type A sorting domain-containing protein [bacterium]|nr:T9SS type A sorting domain-containing protein [Candidatus Kapabacteria bacterium]